MIECQNNRAEAVCKITISNGDPYPIAHLINAETGQTLFSVDPYRTAAGEGMLTYLAENYNNLGCYFPNPISCEQSIRNGGNHIYLDGVNSEFFNYEPGTTGQDINRGRIRRAMTKLKNIGVCKR